MKTFWLYYGERIVGGFRGKVGATLAEVKADVLKSFKENPFMFNDWVTEGVILHAEAKE